MFSSVDVCSLDLYSGICEFVKAGAATTFIRRSNWVETITSTSMAAGLVQQLDFEKTSKKLYDGDYLVMVTDGVLDALPVKQEEEDHERNHSSCPGRDAPRTGAVYFGKGAKLQQLLRSGRYDSSCGRDVEKIRVQRTEAGGNEIHVENRGKSP